MSPFLDVYADYGEYGGGAVGWAVYQYIYSWTRDSVYNVYDHDYAAG
jgi:hypothetical protein